MKDYIGCIEKHFVNEEQQQVQPWQMLESLEEMLMQKIQNLNDAYRIENNIAIHSTVIIEQNVILKGVVVISENCFIGANSYLRGPVFLAKSVIIGPSCEIKQSIILENTSTAHFNYIGNSIVGQNCNLEAGSICANHYNEREHKVIKIKYKGKFINTATDKFGSLIGDYSKIGANAVLSPGTILEKNSIIKRLELVEQSIPNGNIKQTN